MVAGDHHWLDPCGDTICHRLRRLGTRRVNQGDQAEKIQLLLHVTVLACCRERCQLPARKSQHPVALLGERLCRSQQALRVKLSGSVGTVLTAAQRDQLLGSTLDVADYLAACLVQGGHSLALTVEWDSCLAGKLVRQLLLVKASVCRRYAHGQFSGFPNRPASFQRHVIIERHGQTQLTGTSLGLQF